MWTIERLDHLDGLVLTPLHGDSPQSYPQTGRVLAGETVYLAVALDVPLPGLFDYSHDRPVAPGVRVRVTFGRRAMVGMVWAVREAPGVSADRVRPIDAVLDDHNAVSAGLSSSIFTLNMQEAERFLAREDAPEGQRAA